MFAITVAETVARHSRGVTQAYTDIASELSRFGFRRVQGSVYVVDDENIANLVSALNALKALPWFPGSVRDIRAFRMEQWSDFTDYIKRGQ